MAGMLDSLLFDPYGGAFMLPPDGAHSAIPAVPAGLSPPVAATPPPGFLASMFGGSGAFPTTMPTGGFGPDPMAAGAALPFMNGSGAPTTAGAPPAPMPSPSAPGASAMASAVPMPPMDLSPPPAPQGPAGPSQAPDQPAVPQTSLLGRFGSLFGDKAGSALGGIGDSLNAHSNTLMALGAGMAGAPTLGMGLSRGLTNALPASQLDRQQGFQNGTLAFLKSRGMSDDQAKMVLGNPTLMQQLAPQIFGVKQQKFTQIGEDIDQYGNKVPRYGFVNEVNGTITPYGSAPTGGGAAGGVNMADADKHGEDYLGTLDPNRASILRSIGEGRQPMPSGAQLKQPAGMALRAQVTQAYPDLNEQTFPARQKAFNDFYGGGKDQGVVASVRQSAGHMLALSGSLQDLNNVAGGKVVNAPINAAEEALGIGSGANLPAVRMNVHAVADELGKIWKGGTNSDAEVKSWEENFPYNGTLAQQKAALGKAAELYRGGVDSLERKHRDSFGPAASGLPPIRDDQAEQTISGIEKWAGGKSTTPPAPGQGTPAPAAPGMQTLPRPQSKQDYDGIPSGQPYIAPDGKPYVKGR